MDIRQFPLLTMFDYKHFCKSTSQRKKAKKSLLRPSLIARRWHSSIIPFQPVLPPLDYGWTLQDGKYKIDWFHGEQAPTSLYIVMQEDEDDVEEENQDSAEADNISEDESSDDEGDDHI